MQPSKAGQGATPLERCKLGQAPFRVRAELLALSEARPTPISAHMAFVSELTARQRDSEAGVAPGFAPEFSQNPPLSLGNDRSSALERTRVGQGRRPAGIVDSKGNRVGRAGQSNEGQTRVGEGILSQNRTGEGHAESGEDQTRTGKGHTG